MSNNMKTPQSVDRTTTSDPRSHLNLKDQHIASQSSQKLLQSGSHPGQTGLLENYQIGKAIGQGAFAIVYVCYHKATMKKCAIKIYQKVKLNDSMKRKAV